MTAIRGHVKPTAEHGALGIHSLDQFVLSVPDLSVAQTFYDNFGLDVQSTGKALSLKTFGNAHRWGSVIEGQRKKLHHLSFGCYAEDLPRLKARIEGNGIKLVDPPPGLESNGFWFVGFDNILTEVKVAAKSSPDQKSEVTWPAGSPGEARAPLRKSANVGKPRRLAHGFALRRRGRHPIPPRRTVTLRARRVSPAMPGRCRGAAAPTWRARRRGHGVREPSSPRR